MSNMKKITLLFLVMIGISTLLAGAWRFVIHLADKNGFWFSYYCADIPVTIAETDNNKDGYVQREEAAAKCSSLWTLRREIKGTACIEYMGPKDRIPVITACRVDPDRGLH